jgi:hypothetical protein
MRKRGLSLVFVGFVMFVFANDFRFVLLAVVLILAGFIFLAVSQIGKSKGEVDAEEAADKEKVTDFFKRVDDSRKRRNERWKSRWFAAVGAVHERWSLVRRRQVRTVGLILFALSLLFPPHESPSWDQNGVMTIGTVRRIIGTAQEPIAVVDWVGQLVVLSLVAAFAYKKAQS